MNHVFIYVGAGITAVIILIAGFFIQKEFRLRQAQTNLRLPDIDELEREARLAKMKESSEEIRIKFLMENILYIILNMCYLHKLCKLQALG